MDSFKTWIKTKTHQFFSVVFSSNENKKKIFEKTLILIQIIETLFVMINNLIKKIFKSCNLLTATLLFFCLLLFMMLIFSFAVIFGYSAQMSFIDQAHINLFPVISITCGGIVAILAFFRDRENQRRDSLRKKDEMYLEISKKSFDEVFNLLKNCNNDRMIWIRASRLLLNTLAFRNKIETPDIIEAFDLATEQLRVELYRVLSMKSGQHKDLQPLPPAFFYGNEDWETEVDINQAAIKSKPKIEGNEVTIDKNVPVRSCKWLQWQSVIAIYDFLEYPSDYDDPLDRVNKWNTHWCDSRDHSQGARKYIAHRGI